jgi:uncharacterized protein YqgQ
LIPGLSFDTIQLLHERLPRLFHEHVLLAQNYKKCTSRVENRTETNERKREREFSK